MKTLRSRPRTSIISALLAIFLTGFVVGISETSAQTTTIAAWVNPGTASTTANLTCLWHGFERACPNTDSYNQALDWSQSAGQSVLFRTWAYRSNSTGYAYTAVKHLDNGNCRRVRFDIEDAFGATRGSEYYTHTWLVGIDGWSYAIQGSPAGTFTWKQAGTTVHPNDELGTCELDGAHLHQAASNFMSRNTSTYSSTGWKSGLANLSMWQHGVSWNQ